MNMDISTTPIYKKMEDYRRLIDIARDLASTLDRDILLDRIVHAAADITGAEAATILLYDNNARQLYFQAATNMDPSHMRGQSLPLDGSIAGWILRHRQPARIADVSQDPRHFDDVEQITNRPTNSLLGVPLITKEKVIGVLEAINKREREFTEREEDLLSVLGAQAAVAIENARLFQQSDLISEFVHELRTPLASLSTATYLLLRPEISQQQREQIVQNIHNETLRLNTLASSFLDLARLESGRVRFHPSLFNVMDLLNECQEVMQSRAESEGLQVTIEPCEHLPLLEADRDKVKQVVLNMISNAIKYNRPDGSITLKADMEGEENLCILVQDTGVGIAQEALPHLFEKFYRVRDTEGQITGTGLGLSICKQIVQGHGGSIEVESELTHGTIFKIKLPLHPRSLRRDTRPLTSQRP